MKHLITLLFVFQLFAGNLWSTCFGQDAWKFDSFCDSSDFEKAHGHSSARITINPVYQDKSTGLCGKKQK